MPNHRKTSRASRLLANLTPVTLTLLVPPLVSAPVQAQDLGATSLNNEIQVVPAPGPVKIDGKTDDWDLSAGIWSYNDPTLVDKYSVWTHLMWDEKGVYWLARYHDLTPLKNATLGKDFALSWRADAYQARVVFDSKLPDEHQMHINIFYSTPEKQPYMIVKHGGFKAKPPYDATGPDRPDLLERFGTTMDAAGGKVAFSEWPDGKGYNAEAFWPWKYARLNGQPLKPGEEFVFGLDAIWSNFDGSGHSHRLVDNMRDEKVNRIFFFRDRQGWGKAIINAKGKLGVTEAQKALQQQRLKQFVDFDTYGSIPIKYELPEDREVTIAIENEKGERVRNLFGQYPRKKGPNTDLWDGLDDKGNPVPAGNYRVIIADHLPFTVKAVNSVYNAATPPWIVEGKRLIWGSNHGHPTSVSTRGDLTLVAFTGVEGATGLLSTDANGIIDWCNVAEVLDTTADEKYAYTVGREWNGTTLLRRMNLKDGKTEPFADAKRSPEITLPVPAKEMPNETSIAYFGGKIYILLPGRTLYRLAPATGELEATLERPDLLAITERGDALYGLAKGGKVVQLDAEGNASKTLFTATNLVRPVRLGVSQDNARVAISDFESNQVFIYNTSGKLLQTLGKAYVAQDDKRAAGKFEENNFIRPLGLDFDSRGRLWVAEAAKTSRRITVWNPAGKLDKQFWGAADYGAMAGFPITFDSNRFIAHGVEFQLDPNPDFFKRPTAEKPLIFHPDLAESRGLVYKLGKFEYAVTTPGYNKPTGFEVAVRDSRGVFVPRVKVTYDRKGLNGKAWTDINANGKEDPGETMEEFKGQSVYWSNGWIRPDLTIITPNQLVYAPKSINAAGVPIYDFANPVKPANAFPSPGGQGSSGTTIMDNAGNISNGIVYSTVDGRKGAYPNRYGRHDAPAAQRGVLIAPFRTNGVVENVPGVGSVTALGGDRGEWFLLSMDGIYLSSILQDSKAEVTLDHTFVGQESFGGFLWRDEKGRVMAQLGGASYRIVEITGLDSTRRNQTNLAITAEQVEAGQKIASARKARGPVEPESLTIAKVARVPAEPAAPAATGELIDGAQTFTVQEGGDPTKRFRAALAQDGTNLSVMWQVNDANPWINGEGRFTHAFIGGDCVDIQLDIPGRGPVRILGAPLAGKNTVAYWQKTAEVKENPLTYVVGNNQANAQRFDVVKRLDNARLSVTRGDSGYTALMTIPLAELGLDVNAVKELKGVVGVIFSDPAGQNRASRLYWFNKSTGLVSDVPSESRLANTEWGRITLAQ